MASASTQSGNEPAKDLILVHTVQLKPMIKAQKKTRQNKLIMIIIIILVNEKKEM